MLPRKSNWIFWEDQVKAALEPDIDKTIAKKNLRKKIWRSKLLPKGIRVFWLHIKRSPKWKIQTKFCKCAL